MVALGHDTLVIHWSDICSTVFYLSLDLFCAPNQQLKRIQLIGFGLVFEDFLLDVQAFFEVAE